MSTTIHIPATAEGVDANIAAAMDVLAAGEWPLAAWLAARVRLGKRGGDTTIPTSENALTPNAFAKKGIRGLTSDVTVRRYVKAWLDQNDQEYPVLGTDVEMPTVAFPGNSKTDDTEPGAQKVRDVKNNANAVRTALADPEFAKKVVADMPSEVRTSVADAIEQAEDPGLADRLAIIRERERQSAADKAVVDEKFGGLAIQETRLLTTVFAFMHQHPERAQAIADRVATEAMTIAEGLVKDA